jgi:hypothetical protein
LRRGADVHATSKILVLSGGQKQGNVGPSGPFARKARLRAHRTFSFGVFLENASDKLTLRWRARLETWRRRGMISTPHFVLPLRADRRRVRVYDVIDAKETKAECGSHHQRLDQFPK